MNFKKSLLIALLSFGIAQSAFAETDSKGFLRLLEVITQEDTSAAFPELKQFAEQGKVSAQYTLGERYRDGKGVAKNDQQAVYWFTKAAEQGYAAAQFNLGVMYKNGIGVLKDLSKAKYYYGLACDGGDQEGCENYADLDKQGVK